MATSPIQAVVVTQQGPMSSGSGGGSAIGSEDVTADGKRSLPKGAHVRFSTVEVDGAVAEGNFNFSTYTCI